MMGGRQSKALGSKFLCFRPDGPAGALRRPSASICISGLLLVHCILAATRRSLRRLVAKSCQKQQSLAQLEIVEYLVMFNNTHNINILNMLPKIQRVSMQNPGVYSLQYLVRSITNASTFVPVTQLLAKITFVPSWLIEAWVSHQYLRLPTGHLLRLEWWCAILATIGF